MEKNGLSFKLLMLKNCSMLHENFYLDIRQHFNASMEKAAVLIFNDNSNTDLPKISASIICQEILRFHINI